MSHRSGRHAISWLGIVLVISLAGEANATKKKRPKTDARDDSAAASVAPPAETTPVAPAPATETGQPADGEKALDFDFFANQGAAGNPAVAPGPSDAAIAEAEQASRTRRWMLKTHQMLGITTWTLLASTVIIGQLNYNELYGGGGGSQKWQTPHEVLVISTTAAFATAAAFAILAPNPYKKPLHLDSGLIHRIAVVGASLGMLSEMVLGWITTHQANAGNPTELRTMARTHQIIGYSTLGCLTVAGAVWVF